MAQHVALVAASTLAAVAAGVPLGILAARRPRVGGPLSAAASVVQTIPSLALWSAASVHAPRSRR
jgi:osmoprotectant transport system permease protein